MAQNLIYSINGPVVTIKGKTGLSMMEMVHVGNDHLVGEVIRMDEELTTIQVYEETSGLAPGEPVTTTGGPLCVTLGPGILRNIYDGIQRPLPALEKESGPFIARGCNIPSLDPDAKWDVTVTVKVGDKIVPGQIYATCPETPRHPAQVHGGSRHGGHGDLGGRKRQLHRERHRCAHHR